MTEKQLADAAGISQGYLNKIENGLKTPSLQTIEKLGNALRIDPGRLIVFDITYKQDRDGSRRKSTPK